jgi:excisionase family DNA binding protein
MDDPYQGKASGSKPGWRGSSMNANLLSVEQAAERLGLSLWTVYRLARGGGLRSIQIGRRRLFAEEDLEAFVKATRSGAGSSQQSRGSRDG